MSDLAAGYARLAEDEKLMTWRREFAEHLGYDYKTACEIALDRSIDLHDLHTLLVRGCPRELALQILR